MYSEHVLGIVTNILATGLATITIIFIQCNSHPSMNFHQIDNKHNLGWDVLSAYSYTNEHYMNNHE
jgi:hypothetical protein